MVVTHLLVQLMPVNSGSAEGGIRSRDLPYYMCSGLYLSTLALLRSWVQIPPGPLLPVVQIRHCFELVSKSCRTKTQLKT